MRRALLGLALAAACVAPAQAGAAAKPSTWNTTPVGHLDPGRGFNADIWVHHGVAYMGGWGAEGKCPVTGVKAIGVKNPSRPRLLARFAQFPRSTSEDVWVGRIDTPSFLGDLAAVGIQQCSWGSTLFRGLALYDVTRPAHPRLLGKLGVGLNTRGVHELSVVQRADGRVLALLSTPFSWNHSESHVGDIRIVDITDPRAPVQIADWDMRRDGPPEIRHALVAARDLDQLYAHSIQAFDGGLKAFVSHWDAGAVFLDLADPAHPAYLGRTSFPSGAYGNTHSGTLAADGLFLENDEVGDFFHNHHEHGAWGTQRIFDAADPTNPARLGTFATEHSIRGRDGKIGKDGIYSVHNSVLAGTIEVVSWYSDGVRIVNLANPRRPREIGRFVPPPKADPQRYMVAPNGNRRMPLVWGVVRQGSLVYASDMNSGLWIFRAKALAGHR